MTIARRLKWYLETQGVDYELLSHAHTSTSLETAEEAHVPADHLAKCVLLEDELGYLMAILPASHRIEFGWLDEQTGRRLELATEAELGDLFGDCEIGAVPPVGQAYGIRTMVDDVLLDAEDVYFEAGDHEDVVHVDGPAFRELVAAAIHSNFSLPA
jgi:Ala-tRNA(Pro) deacylase